jgi:hypothetical protein
MDAASLEPWPRPRRVTRSQPEEDPLTPEPDGRARVRGEKVKSIFTDYIPAQPQPDID